MLPHPPRLGAFEKEDEMSQIDESVEDLCLLIKSLHEEMSTVHRKVDVLLAIKTDNTEALREMVASGPALDVVPNEDEAMPVLASCPTCNHTVYDEYDVEQEFGYRTPTGRETIVQSWCRKCRALEQATSPRKRAKAISWSKMDAQACAFAKAYTQARNEMKAYAVKMSAEGLAPSVRANLVAKYEAKRAEQAKHKSEYNKRVAVLQSSLTK
jgi:hypothetical protein